MTVVVDDRAVWAGRTLAETGVLMTWRVGGEWNAGGFHMGARHAELGERVCAELELLGGSAVVDPRDASGDRSAVFLLSFDARRTPSTLPEHPPEESRRVLLRVRADTADQARATFVRSQGNRSLVDPRDGAWFDVWTLVRVRRVV